MSASYSECDSFRISFLSVLTCMLIMLPVFFVSASPAYVVAYLGLSVIPAEYVMY